MSENARAILWVMVGTALFSLVYASNKFVGEAATSVQILFLRYIGGFATLIVIVTVSRMAFSSYRSPRPHAHVARAACGCFGGAAITHASATMPIVDATAIGLLYVVMVIPLGMYFFRERLRLPHIAAISLATLGAATIMASRGAFQSFESGYLLPALIAGGGAFLLAFEGILIKALSEAEKAMSVLLHVNFFGIILMAIPAVLSWRSVQVLDNLPFLMLGPLAITAQYCIVRGYRMADITIVGPIDYTWLIFAGLIGLLFFGEVPTAGVLFGAGLIAIGGILLSRPTNAR